MCAGTVRAPLYLAAMFTQQCRICCCEHLLMTLRWGWLGSHVFQGCVLCTHKRRLCWFWGLSHEEGCQSCSFIKHDKLTRALQLDCAWFCQLRVKALSAHWASVVVSPCILRLKTVLAVLCEEAG